MAFHITSEKSLLHLAMFYCSKRETSRAKLGLYLRRKCSEQKIDPSISKTWIPNVLDACEEQKMVDDKRYAEILIRDYTSRGKGRRYIEQKLIEKGISKNTATAPNNENEELERALKLAQKILQPLKSKVAKKAQKKDIREEFELKQKMLQKLCSSGFSIEISRQAIKHVLGT